MIQAKRVVFGTKRFALGTADLALRASDRDFWCCDPLPVLLGQLLVRLLYGQDSNNVMIDMLNIWNI